MEAFYPARGECTFSWLHTYHCLKNAILHVIFILSVKSPWKMSSGLGCDILIKNVQCKEGKENKARKTQVSEWKPAFSGGNEHCVESKHFQLVGDRYCVSQQIKNISGLSDLNNLIFNRHSQMPTVWNDNPKNRWLTSSCLLPSLCCRPQTG